MVSIIIPTLNEEPRLPSCLKAILPEAKDCGAEVLVIDGGSADATTEVARSHGVDVVVGRAGRGRQMNLGAREASGSLLVFLPADTVAPAGWVRTLAAIDAEGTYPAGGFQQRFDHSSLLLRVVSGLHNLRARITGVIYGDQVPFVRRELFLEMGGYREDLDMEDVEFGARLRRRCRPRLLDPETVTSARRFEHVGAFRATAEAAYILACWTFFRKVPRSRTFFTPIR